MKSNHTPGPWTVKQRDLIVHDGKLVAEVQAYIDADLIAAAPDMYRALDIARAYVSQQPNAEDVLREIEAAIAKVEGTPHSKSEAKRLNTLKGRK